ncbi:hypothetical protein Dimus_004424 [Dionaea muscipula]
MRGSDLSEVATETVAAVRFGFMTDEEVRKHSVRKITRPNLFDGLVPARGGLYDPALGPLKEKDRSLCITCGQSYDLCPGHCGHIELVTHAYHPLMFTMLCKILQKTCFYCYHFRAPPLEVEGCVYRLKHILHGDIVRGATNHAILNPTIKDVLEVNDFMEAEDAFHSDGENLQSENLEQRGWTSWQLMEALSVLAGFLKKKLTKCTRCAAKNPPISRPNIGMIRLGGLSDANVVANIIRGCTVGGPLADGNDEKSASEVDNANDPSTSKKRKRRTGKEAAVFLKQKETFSQTLFPSQVMQILERLWENEARLCSFICDIQQQQPYMHWKNAGYCMFFLKSILVPPLKYRPPSIEANAMTEHAQTSALGQVVEANIYLGNAYENQDAKHSDIVTRWFVLQRSINTLFDSRTAMGRDAVGICQLLDRKEGIFRQKMMGKRVNFACRSVISPDPCLAVNEIGLPLSFALKLTYPERVTPWNTVKLRDAIVNGPDVHPGATNYIDKIANVRLPALQKRRIAISRRLSSSRGVVTGPMKSSNNEFEGKVVLRHIQNGDIVLVNRQPTLHKPSIIALKVRVLPGEKTLRMHYANCDSFNADFDGDEINVHFPQDEISRAEAYNIVHADEQYIVPTRGDPKRALIQDHIVSAVLLTKKDTFLTREEFNELVYSSGLCTSGSWTCNAKPGQKVSVVNTEDFIASLSPAIVKPQRLWTGKQVITAILDHITKGDMPFTVKKRAKIAREYFGKDISKKNEELSKMNVSHNGNQVKIDQISQHKGEKDLQKRNIKVSVKETKAAETMNYGESIDEDMVFVYKNELVQGVIDKEQFGKYGLVHTVQELYGSKVAGNLLSVLGRVFTAFLQIHGFTCGVDDLLLEREYDKRRNQLLKVSSNCGEDVHLQFIGQENEQLDFEDIQIEVEKAIRRNGESAVAMLDGMMRNKLNASNSALGSLFPCGLVKPFRRNCLSLMTLSGAKGGTFNFQQISLLLGQQELEGKRVPRMVSGKTLPCFPPWDISSRAGGFIADRFLTGLRPQEFYFHCMAGREGLVDTAVKTARSGYLQRCLIKNLESLKVHYDYTVRDSDGSIVQFRYGEDGVDVHQKNFIEEFDALAMNQEILQKKLLSQTDNVCMPEFVLGANEYPNELVRKADNFTKNETKARIYGLRQQKDRANFLKLVKSKYFSSLAQPGEPVGVIAAQSVGEPSTQMTLNTFHHAGRGELNVTLGIPRLQEILMTASATIRTPTMACPLYKSKSRDDAEHLAAKLKRISVADLIEKMEVSVVPFAVDENYEISTIYKLHIKLYEPELYPPHTNVSMQDCEETLKGIYPKKLELAIQNHMLLLSKIRGIADFVGDLEPKSSKGDDDEGEPKESRNDDNDDNDDNGDAGDLGTDVLKTKLQSTDEMEYEDFSEDGLPQEKQEGEMEIEKHEDEMEIDDQAEDDDDDDDEKLGREEEALKEKHEGEIDSEVDQAEDEDDEKLGGGQEALEDSMHEAATNKSETNSSRHQVNAKKGKRETDRVFLVKSKGMHFEFHLRFRNEPHILLTQIAQQTAKNVFVKSYGKIEQCKVVELHLDDPSNSQTSGIPMLRKGKETRHGLQTAGVDFHAFWKMDDDLDINYIASNDIHAVLNTYGVEAARAAIVTEVFRVFNHYGVSVDMRHLSLIADHMTHTGGYRPMSRFGAIADSISPFAKMSFETSSKFAVEAANYGLADNMETPSARICVGLPAKVGTGCFDLFQDLTI